MARTPTQNKAIAWWCKKNDLIPQLSTHPTYCFKDKASGEITNRNIDNLTRDYKRSLEEERKDNKARKGKDNGRGSMV